MLVAGDRKSGPVYAAETEIVDLEIKKNGHNLYKIDRKIASLSAMDLGFVAESITFADKPQALQSNGDYIPLINEFCRTRRRSRGFRMPS